MEIPQHLRERLRSGPASTTAAIAELALEHAVEHGEIVRALVEVIGAISADLDAGRPDVAARRADEVLRAYRAARQCDALDDAEARFHREAVREHLG